MLNDKGQEVPDTTPVVIRMPSRIISQWDDVRSFIRRELSAGAAAAHVETFEEANDFDVDDDPPISSRWEYSADQEEEDRQVIASMSRQKNGVGVADPSGSPAEPAKPVLDASATPLQTPPADARKVDSP